MKNEDGDLRAMTPREVARTMALGENTIRSAIAAGDLAAWRSAGGHWKIRRSAVLDWVSHMEAEAASAVGGGRRM